MVTEHDSLEDAARAQAHAAVTAHATLLDAEQLGDGEPRPIRVADLRYHQVRSARWHVVIRHPDGAKAVHSVWPTEQEAQTETARLALLVGARRVRAVPASI